MAPLYSTAAAAPNFFLLAQGLLLAQWAPHKKKFQSKQQMDWYSTPLLGFLKFQPLYFSQVDREIGLKFRIFWVWPTRLEMVLQGSNIIPITIIDSFVNNFNKHPNSESSSIKLLINSIIPHELVNMALIYQITISRCEFNPKFIWATKDKDVSQTSGP